MFLKSSSQILVSQQRLMLPGLFCLLCISCSPGSKKTVPSEEAQVFTSIEPHAYFAEAISKGRVQVSSLISGGQSPHTYTPTPKQMVRLSSSKLLFRIGVPFEETLLGKLTTLKELKIVDLREGIKQSPMPAHDHHDAHADADPKAEASDEHHGHSHGHGAHEGQTQKHANEEELDPHIWLDPQLAKLQATKICEALCMLKPEHAKAFRANLASVTDELEQLHQSISQKLKPYHGAKFLAVHPAFGYFAKAYGLTQISLEFQGKPSGLRRTTAIIDQAKKEGIRIILVQSNFRTSDANQLAKEIGGTIIVADPLAKDYLKNLAALASNLHKALQENGS